MNAPATITPMTLALVLTVMLGGCVERTVTIKTEPEHALVWLNDEEVGRTPCRVHFTFYGDYDVVIRKQGYQTLKTHRRLVRPWYQYIPFDAVAELLIPATIHDDHEWQFELQQAHPADPNELLTRALEMRREQMNQSPQAVTSPGAGEADSTPSTPSDGG